MNFTADSKCVKKGESLAGKDCYSDLDVVTQIYNFVIKNISYDKKKAENVPYGYTPDPDETLDTGKGICFDYAAVMTFLMIAVILVLMQKSYLFFPKFMPNSEAS